jgi:hypothetical protein
MRFIYAFIYVPPMAEMCAECGFDLVLSKGESSIQLAARIHEAFASKMHDAHAARVTQVRGAPPGLAASHDITARPQHAIMDSSSTETDAAASDKGLILDASVIMPGAFGSTPTR